MDGMLRLVFRFLIVAVVCAAGTAACQSATQTVPPAAAEPTPVSLASATASAASPAAPTPSPTAPLTTTAPAASPTQAYTGLCSPLEGESLADLGRPDLLKNPFQPPPAGDDGGHFGADFAYWTRPDGSSMRGLPIYSVLDGVVTSVIENRQPYGNAVIIETTLEQIDPEWQTALPLENYDPAAPLIPATSLTCPAYEFAASGPGLSLYLLYAHMLNPAGMAQGSRVSCGQQIGQVGTTGNSVNEHLHLEVRIGPSGIEFASMAHYDTSATSEEMRNYCLWRLSGAFMPFDPMLLLNVQ